MGTIRFLLAIAVVLTHTGAAFNFLRANIAVEMFFLASGFLISFVLRDSGAYRSDLSRFYLNRALRLYPIYYVVLAISTFGFLVFPTVLPRPALLGADLSFPSTAYILITNITLIGQDWAYLMGLNNGQLIYQPEFFKSVPPVWTFFPVPQAWTLGIEALFYLIAPFIVVKRSRTLIVFAVFFTLKFWSMYLMLGEPWYYRFLPFELSLFLLGSMAHQWFLPLYRSISANYRNLDNAIFCLSVFILLSYWWLPIPAIERAYQGFAGALALSFSLPALFAFQRRSKLDRWIGELSYPIYINHWLMIPVGAYLMDQWGLGGEQQNAAFTTLLSVLFAVLLNLFVSDPLERLRARIRGRSNFASSNAT